MAPTVKTDRAQALNKVIEGAEGIEITRAFRVEGLDAVASARILQAHNAAGIPAKGDAHPDDASLIVLDKETQILTEDPTVAVVTCRYRVPQPGEDDGGSGGAAAGKWEMDASTVTEESNTDRDGNPLEVAYFGNPDNLPPGVFSRKNELFDVGRLIPRTILRFTRTETGMPDQLARVHVGTVNQAPIWSNPPWPAKTLLLLAIRAVQVDFSADRYEVSYEFGYDAELWQFTGRVTIYGIVPSDAVLGDGIEVFDLYPESDFSLLNIPSPN